MPHLFHRRLYLVFSNKYTIPLLCVLLFLLGCLLHYQRGYFSDSPNFLHVTGSDDAYISYRYGWNLIHHGILSWNESGFRQVEGFTNPLWVYLSAAWALTDNLDAVYPGVTITSVILTAVILFYLAYRIRNNCSRTLSLSGMLVLSLSPIFWSHTTSGMESGVFGALVALIAYSAIFDKDARSPWIEILVFIAVLLRSDAFLYMLIVLFALFLTQSPHWKRVAAGLVLGVLTLFSWRFLMFGEWMPNTAVAKLNFPWTTRVETGIRFFLDSSVGLLPLLLIGFQALRYMNRKQQIASGLVVAGWSAYYIYIGGDVYLERHLIGVMVLLAGMASLQFDRADIALKPTAIIVAILVVFLYLPMMMGDSRFEYWKPKLQDPWVLMGKEIGKDRDRYGVIIIPAAGKIPYFAGGEFVDELGLNDPYLATLKRETFIPGHAAGSREAALQIAQSTKEIFSICAFGNELSAEHENHVFLWVDNLHANQGVHTSISNAELSVIMASHPLGYTILIQGRNP